MRIHQLSEMEGAAQAGWACSDEEDIDFQSLAFALSHSVSCHWRIRRRSPTGPLQHNVSENHRLAGQAMRFENAGLLQLLAFGPADGGQLVLADENLHAA